MALSTYSMCRLRLGFNMWSSLLVFSTTSVLPACYFVAGSYKLVHPVWSQRCSLPIVQEEIALFRNKVMIIA